MSNLFPNVVRRVVPLHSQQIRWLPRWSHRRPAQVIPADQYDKAKDTQIKNTLSDEPQTLNKTNWKQNTADQYDKDKDTKIKNKFSDDPHTLNKINWKQKTDSFKNKDDLRTSSRTNWRQKTNSFNLENDNKIDDSLQYKFKTKNPRPLTIRKKVKTAGEPVDMLEATIDADGNFIYTKMKNNDSRIGSILVDIKSKKEKGKRDLMLLEGKRLIKDALDAGCKLEYILFSRMKEVEYLRESLPKIGAKLYKMPYTEMQMWSSLTTNPGIMGLFKIPDTESVKPHHGSLPLTIICDNVREPNNLGAILRTCSGVGCEKIVLTKGCVNVWDSKVLRSASGAHFKLHISKKLSWDDIKEKVLPDSSIYIADNRTVSTDYAENDTEKQDLAELLQAVPVLPYYGVEFRNDRHVVLIVGGETEGVSEESYKLASELNGARLNIPLSNNIESLNTGTALGIIVFEMKRQLSVLQEETDKKSDCVI